MPSIFKSLVAFVVIFSGASPLRAQNKDCLVCSFTIPNEAKTQGADPCVDMYAAACLDSEGKSKFKGKAKELTDELNAAVEKARARAIKELGFKDSAEYIRDRLKKAGLELVDDPDKDWLSAFTMNQNPYDNLGPMSDEPPRLFKGVAECTEEKQEIDKFLSQVRLNNRKAVLDGIKKMQAFEAKYRQNLIQHHANNIPAFISMEITEKCNLVKDKEYAALNKEFAATCDKFPQIKKEAIELFRNEGTPGYEEKAIAFVQKYMPPPIYIPDNSNQRLYSENIKSNPETQEYLKVAEAYKVVCKNYFGILAGAAFSHSYGAMADLAMSKPTVEAIIDSFYSKERQQKALRIFNQTRSDVQGLVRGFVKDPKKRGEIIDGYAGLNMYWMEKPGDNYYIESNGLKVLDIESMKMNDYRKEVFSDPNLTFFKELNAFYMPQRVVGKEKSDERVFMNPSLIHQLEENPYIYLSILAHEVGHKIGPGISRINGYDLKPEYSSLLSCYKDNKSIKMLENQQDEVIADYVSSEVLARQIQKLPVEQRKQALISSMEFFCVGDEASESMHMLNCYGTHPDSTLRMSGIYGANPSVRKVLGCEGEPKNFQTCGLKTSILDLPESGNSSPRGQGSSKKGRK